MSNNAALLARLGTLPPIVGLPASVAAAIGRTEAQLADPTATPIIGFHVLLTDALLTVYVISDRVFAMYEAAPDGRDFTLTVPTTRLRRVAKLEEVDATRVVLEIDADRQTVLTAATAAGATEGQIVPAGYEITETEPDRRGLLRAFHRAAAAAVGL